MNREQKKKLEEIMAENLIHMMKIMKDQETQQVPCRRNTKRRTPKHTKLPNKKVIKTLIIQWEKPILFKQIHRKK